MDTFPEDLPGLGWSVAKAPKFATRIQISTSGRELRRADQAYPIWTWTLTYSFLRDSNDSKFNPTPGNGYQELRELMGFFARQQGSFNTFLYNDPTDNFTTNQLIAYGDGTTASFQLVRTIAAPPYGGLFTEPVTQPATIVAVYVNSASVPYTLGAFGVVSLASAPPPGAVVTATFTYLWPVRFVDDTNEFENFMFGLWSLKKLSFQSVLLP